MLDQLSIWPDEFLFLKNHPISKVCSSSLVAYLQMEGWLWGFYFTRKEKQQGHCSGVLKIPGHGIRVSDSSAHSVPTISCMRITKVS